MRRPRMSTRTGGWTVGDGLRGARTELCDADDEEDETGQGQELPGKEEETIEAELRAGDRPLLFRLGCLRKERRRVARRLDRRPGEALLVLRELGASDREIAGPDAEEQHPGDD